MESEQDVDDAKNAQIGSWSELFKYFTFPMLVNAWTLYATDKASIGVMLISLCGALLVDVVVSVLYYRSIRKRNPFVERALDARGDGRVHIKLGGPPIAVMTILFVCVSWAIAALAYAALHFMF